MPSSNVVWATEGPIGTLTFNRPQARNALTWDMYDALVDACEEVDRTPGLRVLVIRGSGEAFAAGTDIAQFREFASGADGVTYERRMEAVISRLERVTRPTIAAVDGPAVGGGCMIALTCDLRLCTPRARFGVPIARTLGNCLSMAAYARFVDMFGPSRVKELLFTARLLTAEEAHAAGYVQEIVPADRIEARVATLARQIADHAPITLWVTKESIRRLSASRTLPEDEDLIAATYTSADFREGVRAFLDKRPPRWTGR
jgi:enoyl-CoA hydratase/carnithine racemase